MSDIHALSGAYAVDALDDLERARFERHLAGCEACRHEVDSLREAAALLPETTTVEPSAALRDRLDDRRTAPLLDGGTHGRRQVRPLQATCRPAVRDRRRERSRHQRILAGATVRQVWPTRGPGYGSSG